MNSPSSTAAGSSLIKCPSITSQASSAAVSVLNGEPMTFTANRFCRPQETDGHGIDWAPRGYEAGVALKSGTAPALVTNHEREAIAAGIPYLDFFDRSNDSTESTAVLAQRAGRRSAMSVQVSPSLALSI